MPLDSVCEPVAASPKELNEDLTVGWPSVIPDATRPDVERFPYPVEIFRAIRGYQGFPPVAFSTLEGRVAPQNSIGSFFPATT